MMIRITRALRHSITCTGYAAIVVPLVTLSGCLSPIALHRAVIEYDRTSAQIQGEMLLLNIARAKLVEPLHFTAVSSVAATFNFESTAGIAASQAGLTETIVAPVFTATVAENPTITIIPIEGEEFTKRILAPIHTQKVAFLARQGVEPSMLVRLLASELVIKEDSRGRVLHNNPLHRDQYIEFRRRTLHLASLDMTDALHVGPILHEEVLPVSLPLDPSSPELLDSLDAVIATAEKGYRWSQPTPGASPALTRPVVGRLIVTNYDLAVTPNEERHKLHEESDNLPANALMIDIKPEGPGGDYPLHGYFLFRSFEDTLRFVASSMSVAPEFPVEKDPRTGPTPVNPTSVLAIHESESEPTEAVFKIQHHETWYWLPRAPDESGEATSWNQEAFRVLNQMYQMTVTDISKRPTPAITIAK